MSKTILTDNTEEIPEKWSWLVDMERTCATLIGQCLGGMLVGDQMSKQEKSCLPWLENPVFGNGAEMSSNQTGKLIIKRYQKSLLCILYTLYFAIFQGGVLIYRLINEIFWRLLIRFLKKLTFKHTCNLFFNRKHYGNSANLPSLN